MKRWSSPLLVAALALAALGALGSGGASASYAEPRPAARTPAAQPHPRVSPTPTPSVPPIIEGLPGPLRRLAPQACTLQVAHSPASMLYRGGRVEPCDPPVGDPDGRIVPVLPPGPVSPGGSPGLEARR